MAAAPAAGAAAPRWDDTTGALPRPPAPADFRDLLEDFYRIHDPAKLPQVDAIAAAYEDRPSELALFLETKYAARYFDRYATHFHSRFFDPARALYDDDALPPLLDVQPLDALYKAQALLPAAGAGAGGAGAGEAAAGGAGRPVALGRLHGREKEEADRRMQELALGQGLGLVDYWADQHVEGPLALLRELQLQRARVRVVVSEPPNAAAVVGRDAAGRLRGVLRGTLAAFDGAGNLVLERVEEVTAEAVVTWEQLPPPPAAAGAAGGGTAPPSLPPGWAARVEPATGRRFYHHAGLCRSQWDPPPDPAARHRWARRVALQERRRTASHLLVPGHAVVSVGRDGPGAPPARLLHALLRRGAG